jgi:hypothetical protein
MLTSLVGSTLRHLRSHPKILAQLPIDVANILPGGQASIEGAPRFCTMFRWGSIQHQFLSSPESAAEALRQARLRSLR